MEKKLIRQGRRLQGELARELCRRLGEYNEEGFTLEDIKHVEILLNVQVKIVCAENFNSIIYTGEVAGTVLYLYKIGNHFHVINSMKALLGSIYYCEQCDRPYDHKEVHKCLSSSVCTMCMGSVHDEERATVYCELCNRYCYNQKCLDNHGEVCSKVYKCRTCNKLLERENKHSCYHYYCRNCNEVAKYNEHKCHMQRKMGKGGPCSQECKLNRGCDARGCQYTEKYLFFDYECMQDSGVHEANLVKVHDCNGKKWTFYDNKSFCEWLISREHWGYTCIAHYAKGYDSHFILRYCVENTIRPHTIYAGTKLMVLEISGIKIIDSMNFVASPLADFPKTFGLKESKKGYFPHFFNTRENQNYIGPIPDVKYYGVDTMKSKSREAFLEWHANRVSENYQFDFKKEIEEYCDSDVDILRRGCLELRKQFLEIAVIDPFRYLTIASVCMAVYRYKYLQENTIAVIETERKEQYSIQSITWLETYPNNIRHAHNGGEVTICGSKVDGYCESTNTVYQYHGCFWHSCDRCYKPDTVNNVNRECMGDLYNKTRERTEQLRTAGYTVVEMWECDWLPKYKTLDSKADFIEPLRPRDAFFGGRTNASQLKVSGKKLRYIDVVSLYPTVMFYDNYPVGHPVKFKNPKKYKSDWFGLVKCKVLAPKGLYHPVLPVKQEKLLFLLCVKCAESKCKECKHTSEERAFTGTWTTIEINKAIEKGYKVLRVYEVWHFKERSNQLFRGYIRDFMKIKLETSPWQDDYKTKEEYITATKEGMEIDIDIDNIEHNPGKRAVAKNCLVNLWGKFGQRLNMKQTVYVTEATQFYKILLDDTLDTTNITLINDGILQITYNKKDCYIEDSKSVNVFIAAFTTANARMRLYDMLDRLGDAVAYYDTDSVIYIDNGTNTVQTGCMLGEWSGELGKDDYMNDWISTGPKSYGYDTVKGKGAVKIKGFTLNYCNAKKLNLESMKQMLSGEKTKIPVKYSQIVRDVQTKKLVNRFTTKDFKLDYDKRMILAEQDGIINTLPWGY